MTSAFRINLKKLIVPVLALEMLIYWFAFDFLRIVEFDSPSYVSAARYLFQLEGGADIQSRITKPVPLILPGFIEMLTGIHPYYTFIAQNILCFLACGILMFKILNIIFRNESIAFQGMLIYTSCQVFAIFSLFVLTDVVGWCFELLLIFLTLLWFFQKQRSIFYAFWIGIIAAVGIFAKESAIAGLIFFFMFILLSQMNFKTKLQFILTGLLGFMLPFISVTFILYSFFENSILMRIAETRQYYGNHYYRFSDITQIFRIFDLFWLIFALGLPIVFKQIFKKNQAVLKSVFFSAILVFLLIPIHPFISDRVLFMLAPFLVIISIYGLQKLNPYSLVLTILAGIMGLIVSWLIYFINIKGMLLLSSIVYALIILLALYRIAVKKKKSTYS